MRFFRRLAGFLGFAKDDGHEVKDEREDGDNNRGVDDRSSNRVKVQQTGLPRKGFGVQAQVIVERSPLGPVLVPCNAGDGGLQGLKWYAKNLRIDEDGDVADEFLTEILPENSSNLEDHPSPRFKIKYSTRPAKVKQMILSPGGQIQHCLEYQGRIHWV